MNFYSIRPEFQYWFLSLASLFLFFSWCSVWTATNPASQLTVLSALSQLLPESFAFPSSSNNLMTNLLLKDYENLYITTMIFFALWWSHGHFYYRPEIEFLIPSVAFLNTLLPDNRNFIKIASSYFITSLLTIRMHNDDLFRLNLDREGSRNYNKAKIIEI